MLLELIEDPTTNNNVKGGVKKIVFLPNRHACHASR